MKKIFLIGIAATAILASCSNDETVEMSSAKTKAISFTNAFVNNGTRSIVDPSLTKETLGSFAVYGFTQKGQIFDGTAVTSVDDGDTWNYTPPQYWVEGNQYAFGAIAPANITVTGKKLLGQSVANYKVGMTVSFSNDGKTDLLHAAPEKGYDATAEFMTNPETVNMTFNHQLSKVKFSFENAVGEVYNIKVTNIEITDAKTEGTLTIAEDGNTWTAQNGSDKLIFGNAVAEGAESEEAVKIANGSEGESYNEILMIPTGTDATYTVTFTVELLNGEVPMGTYNHTATISNVELKLGYCYDFKATLTPENIVVDPENPDAQLKPIKFEVTTVSGWTLDDENQELPIPDSQSGN